MIWNTALLKYKTLKICQPLAESIITQLTQQSVHSSINSPINQLAHQHILTRRNFSTHPSQLLFPFRKTSISITQHLTHSHYFIMPQQLTNMARANAEYIKEDVPASSGGFTKYRCKNFYTHDCLNWVYIFNGACATCMVSFVLDITANRLKANTLHRLSVALNLCQ